MNDRYDAGHGDDGYELVGYDEYGRPMYRQVPAQQTPQQTYDAYGRQGYGYDPYAAGADGRPQQGQIPAQAQAPAPGDPYGTYPAHEPYPAQQPYEAPGVHGSYGTTYGTYDGTGHGSSAPSAPAAPTAPYEPQEPYAPYDPYGAAATSGQQPRLADQTARIPQQAGPPAEPPAEPGADGSAGRSGRPEAGAEEYHTEQFAFVEEPTDDSEDVIDWLKFTENRTERREEARRRARSRVIALAVVLALVAVGGVGYLWYAGKLPGVSSSGGGSGAASAAGAQKRDVVVVHLHDTAKGGTSTALLVDNTTTKQGTTVLLPNSLAVSADDGTATTLAKSVKDDGSSGTRDQLDTVLGTSIQGTWRLDTPYLQNLVDLVGGVEADTDADVPDPDKKKGTTVLVHKGQGQTLSGRMAVAYATYRASGEDQNAQLKRFGQVMQGVLRKMSSDPQAATTTVQTLAQILDPSLTDKDLGTFLAKLAELAKGGAYKTALLPVQGDGTLTAQTSDSVVKDILGGTAKSPGQGSAVRVSVQNASGTKSGTDKARVALLNGGFSFVAAGTASVGRPVSEVTYSDVAHKNDAVEAAKTLGLPASAVRKGTVTANADVSVVLGQDYKPASAQ